MMVRQDLPHVETSSNSSPCSGLGACLISSLSRLSSFTRLALAAEMPASMSSLVSMLSRNSFGSLAKPRYCITSPILRVLIASIAAHASFASSDKRGWRSRDVSTSVTCDLPLPRLAGFLSLSRQSEMYLGSHSTCSRAHCSSASILDTHISCCSLFSRPVVKSPSSRAIG